MCSTPCRRSWGRRGCFQGRRPRQMGNSSAGQRCGCAAQQPFQRFAAGNLCLAQLQRPVPALWCRATPRHACHKDAPARAPATTCRTCLTGERHTLAAAHLETPMARRAARAHDPHRQLGALAQALLGATEPGRPVAPASSAGLACRLPAAVPSAGPRNVTLPCSRWKLAARTSRPRSPVGQPNRRDASGIETALAALFDLPARRQRGLQRQRVARRRRPAMTSALAPTVGAALQREQQFGRWRHAASAPVPSLDGTCASEASRSGAGAIGCARGAGVLRVRLSRAGLWSRACRRGLGWPTRAAGSTVCAIATGLGSVKLRTSTAAARAGAPARQAAAAQSSTAACAAATSEARRSTPRHRRRARARAAKSWAVPSSASHNGATEPQGLRMSPPSLRIPLRASNGAAGRWLLVASIGCALHAGLHAADAASAPVARSRLPAGRAGADGRQIQAAQRDARDRGFLWRVTKQGRSSYLFGTLHLGKMPWIFHGPRLREALAQTDTLALELDLTDPAMLQSPPSRGHRADAVVRCVARAAVASDHGGLSARRQRCSSSIP